MNLTDEFELSERDSLTPDFDEEDYRSFEDAQRESYFSDKVFAGMLNRYCPISCQEILFLNYSINLRE